MGHFINHGNRRLDDMYGWDNAAERPSLCRTKLMPRCLTSTAANARTIDISFLGSRQILYNCARWLMILILTDGIADSNLFPTVLDHQIRG
jgi:hypothetical protein